VYAASTLDATRLRDLLAEVAAGRLPVDEAERRLARLPFEDLGYARVDHHRAVRGLGPEVIYARGKTPE
jgi:pyridinium-3,5-biscarboxylic acid mononucleotide synthase